MNFELSDDQIALREAAASLLAREATPERVRAVVEAGGGYDEDLWAAMVAQGWAGLVVPEASGGLGFATVEAAVLLEQLGSRVGPAPFLQHLVATASVAQAEEPTDGLLDALVAADRLGVVAAGVVAAERGEGEWRLTGTPEPVVYGPSAGVVVLRGSHDAEVSLFAVELDEPSRPAAEPAMDRTRELGWLRLEAAPARRLGGAAVAGHFEDLGATAYAAELLGVATRSLDMAVAYAGEREQFGRPIGSFQAVKHRCADMLVDVEGMRSAVYYAAWCLAAQDPDASIAAATAKTWCSDAGTRVLASALQVHGGIGFTWEHDLHLYLKRAQLDSVSFGDATHHRARLADLLRSRVERGEGVI